jgi:hypothetical protein
VHRGFRPVIRISAIDIPAPAQPRVAEHRSRQARDEFEFDGPKGHWIHRRALKCVQLHGCNLKNQATTRRPQRLYRIVVQVNRWIGRNRGDFLSDRPTPASIPADILALGPELRLLTPQLKRE